MKKASEGLRDLYGYTVELPKTEDTVDYFDDCLLWSRQAIEWLIKFSRRDQNVILPISVRKLVGENDWEKQVASKQIKFKLPRESYFDNMSHVRLRGLGAVALDDDPDRLWQISAEVPRIGTVFHNNGTETHPDQSLLPACRLARVTRRSTARDSDVVGAAVLHNASPVGTWNVERDDNWVLSKSR
jgi:hypothetical protein